MYDLAVALDSGHCPTQLAALKPGYADESRWMNKAVQIARSYMSTTTPSQNLILIVNMIMKVYIPMFFAIKSEPEFYNGSRHYFNMLQSVKDLNLPERIWEPLKIKFINNSYFAHSENIIAAMITDHNKEIRRQGYLKIANIRAKYTTNNIVNLRIFKKPDEKELNLNCAEYTTLINLDNNNVYEPPCVMHFSEDEIVYYMNSNEIIDLQRVPCHTQAVERHVQIVASTAKNVLEQNRLAYILNIKYSRDMCPNIDTKGQYSFYTLPFDTQ